MKLIKKILIALSIFLIIYIIIAKLVGIQRRQRLRDAIDKKVMIYPSQTTIQMAKEGNLKWFQIKDELHENYDYQDILKNSYIHEAIRNKRYDVIEYLVKKNKNFNQVNSEGYYPLGLAYKLCDLRMAQLLEPVSNKKLRDSFGNESKEYLKNCK